MGTLDDWRTLMEPASAPLRAALAADAPGTSAPLSPAPVPALKPALTPALLTRLRATFPPAMVSCAAELALARSKAATKWPRALASALVADAQGVEMASAWAAAVWKARRFAHALLPGTRVLDLCCGVGGDAMALAARGLALDAVDLDPVRAWMAERNAGLAWEFDCGFAGERALSHATSVRPAASIRSVCADVELVDLGAPVHFDPMRRDASGRRDTSGTRARTTRDLTDLVPGPAFLDRLARSAPAGAIKLHPGLDAADLPEPLHDAEIEILSEDGSLTQSVVWFGSIASSPGLRRATLLKRALADPARPFAAEPVTICGLAQPQDDAVADGTIKSWVFAADPSPERAGLLPVLCAQEGVALVHPGTGLLTAESPRVSPWLTAFRVLDSMAWNEKRVRAACAAHGAGVGEVKTRGQAVNPDLVQRRLRGPGERTLTLFVLRFGSALRAVITERARVSDTPPRDSKGNPGAS